jgi:hypothetical protein
LALLAWPLVALCVPFLVLHKLSKLVLEQLSVVLVGLLRL